MNDIKWKRAVAGQTATLTGDDITLSPGKKGIIATLNVQTVPGVDTVLMKIQKKIQSALPAAVYVDLLAVAAGRSVAGVDTLEIRPDLTTVANSRLAAQVPDVYRVVVTHSAGTSFDYQLEVEEKE